MKTPEQKASDAGDARLSYAERAEQDGAWYSAYDALESVQSGEAVNFYAEEPHILHAAWPISGDDLALAKAGKIA